MFKTPSEAAQELGVSLPTIRNWARSGKINFKITPGGQRRYDITSVHEPTERTYNNLPPRKQKKEKKETGAIYCRVSSHKQKDDLERQMQTLKEQYPDYTVYTDICSGLNYKRKGLSRLLERVQEGAHKEVVVAHKDRLARFGTDLIRWIIEHNGANLVILDQTDLSPTEEVTQDLMAIVHVFSCRLNGKRRYQTAKCSSKKRKVETVQECTDNRTASYIEEETGPATSSQS